MFSYCIKSKQYPQAFKLTAGVLISPRRNNYTRGGPGKKSKKFSRKSLTVPKNVAQCRKQVISYLYTLKRTIAYALPNAIAYLNTCIPCPKTSITYLNILTRLSGLGSISWTDTTRLGSTVDSRQPIRIAYYVTRVVSQSESSTEKALKLRQPIRIEHGKKHSTSLANQNRVLRNPSRQPIRIEHYVTRVVITSPESSRLGWKTLVGSRLQSAR